MNNHDENNNSLICHSTTNFDLISPYFSDKVQYFGLDVLVLLFWLSLLLFIGACRWLLGLRYLHSHPRDEVDVVSCHIGSDVCVNVRV